MKLKKLFKRLLDLFKLKKVRKIHYSIRIVSELPDVPLKNVLYLEGDERQHDFWYAFLKCPCGCEEEIMLNLIDDVKPCWKVLIDESSFSISPSIWRTKNCRSHFWIRDGKVFWV